MATSFTTHSAGQVITAADINLVQTAINALENAGAPAADSTAFTTGFSNVPRWATTGSLGLNSTLALMAGFVAPKSMTIANINMYPNGTAVSTHAYVALYSLAANGDGTQIAITADTTSMFTVANVKKTIPFVTPIAVTAGTAYAVAVYYSGGGGPTMTAVPGISVPNIVATGGVTQPWLYCRQTAGATAPLSTFVFASMTTVSTAIPYVEFTT